VISPAKSNPGKLTETGLSEVKAWCGGRVGGMYPDWGKFGKMVHHLCNTLDDRALAISVLDAVKMI
jgi:hypothetical protein